MPEREAPNPRDGSSLADVGIAILLGLLGVPLCEAGWHAIVAGEHSIRGGIALAFGLALGILGLTFHWWKNSLSAAKGAWVRSQAARWWPAGFLLTFVYFVGPEFYQRIFPVDPNVKITGRIIWNFEQTASGGGYFLNMTRLNNEEIRILGFQAQGKNRSTDAITEFKGYLRSDLTNAQIPIYLLAQEPEPSKVLACFPHPWVPTSPEETFGVPALADFQIGTYEKPFAEAGKDGTSVSNFFNSFVPFTLVLEYDGMKVERKFSKIEISRQIEMFEKSLRPLSNPYILRRKTASPPPMSPLRPLISPPANTSPQLFGPPLFGKDVAPIGRVPSKN